MVIGKSQHVNSFYAASVASRVKDWPVLQGEVTTDVCVIGGGFAGISAAFHLAQQGVRVVLLEKSRIAWGASGRNGGHMETLFAQDPDDFAASIGEERVDGMWSLSSEANSLVKDIIEKYQIECDAQMGVGHVGYTKADAEHLMEGAEKFVQRGYRKNVITYTQSELADLIGTQKYYGGFFDMDMIHLNPLQFALGFCDAAEKEGVQIYENSEALSYEVSDAAVTIKTSSGVVRASQLVLATNINVNTIEPQLAKKLFGVKAWVIATEPLDPDRAKNLMKANLAVNDTRMFIDFYRLSNDHRLVFGSVAPISLNGEEAIKNALGRRMRDVYPQLGDVKIDYGWQCKACGTMKFLPFIGRFRPNVYFSLASNVSWAIMNGKLTAEAIAGNNDRFSLVAGIENASLPIGIKGREALVMAYKLYERMRT